MGFNNTQGKLYIVELVSPFDRVEIQFVPRELVPTRRAKLSRIGIVGRNNDLLHYTGGSDTLALALDFVSDEENREDVIQKVDFLKSLAMKDGNKGGFRNVKLVMGDLFRNEIWAIESVVPSLSHFDDDNNYLPIRASVVVNLILDPKTNRLIKDVRRN